FNMMTGFSTLPLQLASILGFFVTAFGIVIFIYVIANYLVHGGSVPGFSFLACIIIIFSGTQLLVLGIFGEYLARVHFRSMDRPSSVIREMIKNTTREQPAQK
ncbi:MAG TPA: glycosyltransferase, partial [Clostridia bacterium]|nr:glycosyltransferase [Clostridia bacterium]